MMDFLKVISYKKEIEKLSSIDIENLLELEYIIKKGFENLKEILRERILKKEYKTDNYILRKRTRRVFKSKEEINKFLKEKNIKEDIIYISKMRNLKELESVCKEEIIEGITNKEEFKEILVKINK